MGAKLNDINISKLQKKKLEQMMYEKLYPSSVFLDEKVLLVKRVISVKSKYRLRIF